MYVSCRNIVGSRVPIHVHLRFRLSQVALHLLGSESPLFEPLLEALNIDRLCTRTVHVAGFAFIAFESPFFQYIFFCRSIASIDRTVFSSNPIEKVNRSSSRSSFPKRKLLWLLNGILLLFILIAIVAFFVIINAKQSEYLIIRIHQLVNLAMKHRKNLPLLLHHHLPLNLHLHSLNILMRFGSALEIL